MHVDTAILSFQNPVFQTYVLAASIMILKLMLQPWMTVVQMMKAGGGFRSLEDAKKSPLNSKPDIPTRVIYVAAKLGLADSIGAKGAKAEDLAGKAHT
jgi:hypothetical protein